MLFFMIFSVTGLMKGISLYCNWGTVILSIFFKLYDLF